MTDGSTELADTMGPEPVAGCPDANRLAQLADGTLGDEARAEVERHLDACAACSELISELAWGAAPEQARSAHRIVGRAGDRYAAVDAHDHTVELRFVDDSERYRALAVDLPHVLRIYAVEREAVTTAPSGELRRFEAGVVAGAAALHRAGFVHGAITRASLRLDRDGRACLDPVGERPPPHTLAPERLHGAPASRAADQFALCVALWELLAGTRPFTGATPGALAVAMQAPPAPPPGGDRHRFAVLARGLAFDPARRWRDLDALHAALVRPARPTYAIVAIACVLAIGLIAFAIGIAS